MKNERLPKQGKNNTWFRYTESDSVLVFMHGVLSDSRNCWLYESKSHPESNCYWPGLIESDPKFKDISIYLAGYYTAPDSGPYEIRNCADEVLAALKRTDDDGNSPVMKKQKITFVCHSMGGIVARYLLDVNQGEFKDKKVGLVLIASPSYGSQFANSLEALTKLFNHQQGVQLQWGNWNLRDLDDRFKELKERKRISDLSGIELYENHFVVHKKWLPIFNRTVVVPKESAGRYFGAAKQVAKTDHFTICKPREKSDLVHQYLFDFLVENQFLHVDLSSLESASVAAITPAIEPTPSDRELITQIVDKDPLTAARAFVFLTERPYLLPDIVSQNPSGPVAEDTVKKLLRIYPEQSANLLMERLRQAGPGKAWHVARPSTSYFDPIHARLCEDELAKTVQRESGSMNFLRLSIEALGRCGSSRYGYDLRKLLEHEDRYFHEKLGSYVLDALARMFVRSAQEPGAGISYAGDKLRDELIHLEKSYPDSLYWAKPDKILCRCDGRHADALIQKWLTSDSPFVSQLAAYVLGTCGIARAVKPLIETIQRCSEEDVIRSCSKALGNIGTNEALEWLLAPRENAAARSGLAFALDKLKDSTGFRRAVAQLLSGRSLDIHERLHLLSAIGRRSEKEFSSVLQKSLEASEPIERGVAALALARTRNSIDRADAMRMVEQAADESERIFAALAVLTLDASVFGALKHQLRRDLGKESYLFWPALQRDILEILMGTRNVEAVQLADAWKPYYFPMSMPTGAMAIGPA